MALNLRILFSMTRGNVHLLLVLLIAFGAFLRLYNISHGLGFHPDERHMIMVAEKLSLADLNPKSFAYGSFPYYLLWAVSSGLGLIWPDLRSYEGLFLVGRGICTLFGLAGIWLTYLLARRIGATRGAGLAAAALLTCNVFHIQLSRFYTVDVVLTTLCLAALVMIVRVLVKGRLRDYLLAGFFIGLSLGSKISALALFVPLGLACLVRLVRLRRYWDTRQVMHGLLAGISALLVFGLVEPYALLDNETFLAQITEQTSMVRGLWRPPYTIQYEHTAAYFYHLQQMVLYTMGWPVALAVLAGLLGLFRRQYRRHYWPELILFSFVAFTFLTIAGYQVKFPRYLLPLYPALFIWAGWVLTDSWRYGRNLLGCGTAAVPFADSSSEASPTQEARSEVPVEATAGGSAETSWLSIALAAGVLCLLLAVLSLGAWYFVFARNVAAPQAEEEVAEPDRFDAPVSMFEGGQGLRLGRFKTARDPAVCPNGLVYVPDANNHRVQVFDAQGTFVRAWGLRGQASGQFNEPHAVACDDASMIYVLDSWNERIQVFDAAGQWVSDLKPPGGLYGARALTYRSGRIYVTDSGHQRVVVLKTDGSLLGAYGEKGSASGKFNEPVGIAVDAEGNIWVADTGNNRLVVLSPNGQWLTALPVPGWQGEGLKEAYLDIDEADRVYLADPVSGAILRIEASRLVDKAGSPDAFQRVAEVPAGVRGLALSGKRILVTLENRVVEAALP